MKVRHQQVPHVLDAEAISLEASAKQGKRTRETGVHQEGTRRANYQIAGGMTAGEGDDSFVHGEPPCR